MPRAAAESSRRAAPLALVPLLIGGCRSTQPVGSGSPASGGGTDAATDGTATGDEPQDGAGELEGEAHDERDYALHGMLSTRFRGRWNSDSSDNDLFQVLTLDAGDPLEDRTSYSLMARLSADLDGRNEDDGFAHGSLEDTYDAAVQGRIYYVYATLRDRGEIEVARVGRQWLHETPEFAWFDGISLTSREHGRARASGGLYGGVSVHPYESSSDGDALAGLWLQAWPWKGGRARLDWMYMQDEAVLGEHQDDLLGISLWQGLGEDLSAEAAHTRVDGEARDVRAAATWLDGGHDLAANVSYYQLLETQGELVLELDPFFNALQELFPFYEARLAVTKGFGESLRTEVGYQARRVEDSGDIGEYNRDFDRGFLSAVMPELLPEEIVLSVTGDWWYATESDVTSLGAELAREWDELEAALGSYYSLFKYDWNEGTERDDVRTWFLRLRWRGDGSFDHELRYEYDDDDLGDVHGLRWVTTWQF